ncbi:hypothetical protein D3C85_1433570 [compost metagenome]
MALERAASYKSFEICPDAVVPVTTQKLSLKPRCVTGICCKPGTEMELDNPGITVTGML